MSLERGGVFFGLMAAVSFGAMNTLVSIYSHRFPATEVAFARGIVGVILLAPWSLSKTPVLLTRKGLLVWARSLAGAISILCIFFNLQNSSVGDAAALANLSSLFVVLITWFILKEKLTFAEWGGVGMVISGVLLLQSPFGSSLPFNVLAVGLGGAFTASLAYTALKKAAQQFSPVLIVWCLCAVTSVASILAPSLPWRFPQGWDWTFVAMVGVLGISGQIFMTHSYMRLPTAVACAVSLSSVLWGVIMESAYDGTVPALGALSSYFIILMGIYILQTRHKSGKPAKRISNTEGSVIS